MTCAGARAAPASGGKMKAFHAVTWVAVYLALVLAPLIALLVGKVPAGNGFWVDTALAMGYAALAMLGVQFFLTARFRRASAPFGIDIIYYFHRLMAVFGFLLIVVHAGILLAAKRGLAAQLFSAEIPAQAIAAIASFTLFLVLIVASVWRKQLRIHYEPWRRWHGVLAIAAVVLAGLHVDWAGYYIQVPWKRALWAGISASWILLLLYVRLLKPFALLRRPYRVDAVRPEAGDAWTLTLRPEGHPGFRFNAGQFAWLTLGRSPFSLSEHPFSISSSAERADVIEFTIKELGDFTRTIGRTPIGTRAYIDGPYGAFSIENYPHAPGFVFLAGGVGIAPILSMLRTLADRRDPRPLHLFYGSWTPGHILLREELDSLTQRLNLTLIHVLQEAPPGWVGETGFLTQDLLARRLPENAPECIHFICGPVPMLKLVEHSLHRLGVPIKRIQSELFDLV